MERRRRERKFLDMLQENSLSRHQKGYSVAQKLGGGGGRKDTSGPHFQKWWGTIAPSAPGSYVYGAPNFQFP